MVKELNGGSKRKLSLALALVGNGKIILMDEPTSGLDLESRNAFWEIIRGFKQNRCIVLSTHHLEEAEKLSDRIGIISEGKLLVLGTSQYIKNKFGVGYTV
jgi:ABC-type multidrug transport system ATPase subunit